jgi:hypothetical protein
VPRRQQSSSATICEATGEENALFDSGLLKRVPCREPDKGA